MTKLEKQDTRGLSPCDIADGELGAAVEAAQAKGAALCRPDRGLAGFVGLGLCRFLHLYRLHRAFSGAQPATDTQVFVCGEELRLSLVGQKRVGEDMQEVRHPVLALVALHALADHRYHAVNLRLGGIDLMLHFLRVAQVKHRRPVVWHLDGETGIHADAFLLQFAPRVLAYKPLQEAICRHAEDIVVLREADVGFLNELAHKDRQFVPVGGCDEPEVFVGLQGDGCTGCLYGLRPVVKRFGYALGNMLAVARS